MMQPKPKISVIISTYNSEKFIDGRLSNLIHQTVFPLIEVIIVNSGSTENEETIINGYVSKYGNIKYIHTEARETIYAAWNRAIEVSSGEFITNANTDDRLKPNALELLSGYLEKNPAKALVYADQIITSIPNIEFEEVKSTRKFRRSEYSRLGLLSNYSLGSQTMWRSSLHFVDNIWFDPCFEIAGDYDFVCRLAEKYKIGYLDTVLGYYYISENKVNKEYQNSEATFRETYAVQKKYAERYFEALNEYQLNQLKRLLKYSLLLPEKIFSLWLKYFELFNPKRAKPPRPFFCWLASRLEEYKGNYEKAKKYCGDYLQDNQIRIIIEQYNSLRNKNLKNN